MQMLNWFLEIRVHNPALAMLHVVFLQFLKRLQVINTEVNLNRKVVFLILPLDALYLILETVRKEAATIAAVFPSPNDVMSILVQVWLYYYLHYA